MKTMKVVVSFLRSGAWCSCHRFVSDSNTTATRTTTAAIALTYLATTAFVIVQSSSSSSTLTFVQSYNYIPSNYRSVLLPAHPSSSRRISTSTTFHRRHQLDEDFCVRLFSSNEKQQPQPMTPPTMTSPSAAAVAAAAATNTTALIEGPILPPINNTNTIRIFWIRHGEVINPGGTRKVYYGAQDVPLSEFGKEEAQLAGMYLQQYPLTNVFSSTLSRAIYGAEQVIQYQKHGSKNTIELIQLDGFKEMDRGEWSGKTIEEIGINAMKRFDSCDESITPIGGESYIQLKNRVLQTRDIVLQKMIQQQQEQQQGGSMAAIVSHLQVTRCIVADALNIPTEYMTEQVSIATASITCIDYQYNSNNSNNNNNADADPTATIENQIVHFQSFKPAQVFGLRKSVDGAN